MRKTLINVSCLFVFTLLFNFNAIAAQEANSDVLSRKFTYHTLTGYEHSLFEGFMAAALPEGKTVSQILTNQASLRYETRLAQALLFRNNPGDKGNAIEILKWMVKNQHTDETSKNYGMWKTNVGNDRLDQNWREFIGCDLIIIYQEYKHMLPSDLLADISTGLIHAAKGAMKRDVGADYTNISIMSAFLMDYTGTEFQMEELKAGGLKKYCSIAGICIAVALDDGKMAPLPIGKGAKDDEMSNLSPILHLGLSIPNGFMFLPWDPKKSKRSSTSCKLKG